MLPLAVPVDPPPGVATQWLLDELGKPEYANARPTPLDLASQAVAEWFAGLFSGAGGAPPVLGLVMGLVLAAGVVVAAVLLGRRARLDRRSRGGDALLEAGDVRSANELRAAAAAAARRGDWAAAIADAYRAIARAAAERELVAVVPGLTARGFAERAGTAFPEETVELTRAAASFDGVRYLGEAGTADDYRRLVELDRRLERRRIGAPA